MARLLLTTLLCGALLGAARQVQGTRQAGTASYRTLEGRNALLGALSPESTAEFRLSPAGGHRVGGQSTLTRIATGSDAVPGEFPWIAALVLRDQHFVFCSATVIDERWLLTAAHCVRLNKPGELDVLVKKNLRDTDPNEVRFQVTDIRLHPENVPFSYQNDMALLRVDRSMVPAAEVISLPSTSCTISEPDTCLVGDTGIIAGWGLLQGDSFELPTVLQKSEVPIIDSRNCARRFARLRPAVTIYDSMLCAGTEFETNDTCQGDSGGPLVVLSDGSYTLEGVVSFGYGCGRPGYYGVYQRVASFTSWIAAEMSA